MKYPSDREMDVKIKKVILSCETKEQFEVASKMISNFTKVVSRDNDALPFILEQILQKKHKGVLGEDNGHP